MRTINRIIHQSANRLFTSSKRAFFLLILLTGFTLSGCDNIEVSINGHQLSSLAITNVDISPAFRPTLSDYSATVPFSVSTISLQASADAGATITINGNAFGGSSTFPLDVGANIFSVVVTGSDGVSQIYTITITREPPSTNANLSNLVVSSGSLNPAFASQIFVYGVSVDSNIQSMTMTPTSEDANASITVNGSSVNSGSATTDFALNVGGNAFSIIVTAEDGTTSQTYTVTVTVNVIVDSTEPVITLLGANPLNLAVGDTYTDPGATADDNFDGDITANIVVGGDTVNTAVADTYIVTYDVSDTAGNPATQVTRTVIVNAIADTTEPVITLLGANPLNLEVGDTYTDPGATADDNLDGDITANIVVGGDTVNTAAVGTFMVTYDVSDLAGNAATQVTRTINVSAVIGSYAFYPNNGSNWNDYLLNDGTNQFDATDTAACVGNETGGYSACIHGGEMRAVEVPDHSVCGDLVATDSLGAFDWVCDGSTNPVRMVSTRLKRINAVVGTTDGTLTNQLLDSTATFITDGVVAGDKVINTTATAITTVVSVASETQLTITSNNFVTGEGYSINRDKNLSDLLDFVTPGWLNNTITVTGTGVGLPFTTPPAAWWSNPVVIDNDGLIAGDAVASTIYLITSDPIAIYAIDASRVALVIQPGVTLSQSAAISVVSQNFLWLEGTISISSSVGADWTSVNFSVIRNLSVLGPVSGVFGSSTGGVYFRDSSNNSLSNIFADNHKYGILLDVASTYNGLSNTTFVNNEFSGVYVNDSSNNSLSDVTANNNGGVGVEIFNSSDNSLSNITANNNGTGVVLSSSSNNNSLSNITANNNVNDGIFLNNSDYNSVSDVTVANNRDNGVDFFNSENNALLNVTTANNDDNGIYFIGSYNNSLSNITAANTGNAGVVLNNSRANVLSNFTTANSVSVGLNFANNSNNTTVANAIAADHGNTGIFLFSSNINNYFTGLLKVGSNVTANCSGAGAGTGINNDCTPEGSSDHTLTTGITLAASFVGKVTTNDTVNLSDTNGTANYPTDSAVFNWSSFENTYRSWGVDGDAFPDVGATNRGQWTTGTGRIWDWSMLTADTVIQDVLTKYLTGDAANSIEHGWFVVTATDQAACTALVPGSEFFAVDDCRSTFLRNAVEISGTGGNDNGLCETDETCLYTPNIGSYQGHGTLISAGTFTAGDSTITGVTLMEYSINGY